MKINICFSQSSDMEQYSQVLFPSYNRYCAARIDIDVAYCISNNAYYNKRVFISNKMFLWGLI